MTAHVLGPVHGVRIAGMGTAFPARALDNLAALRAVPQALGGRELSEERLAFIADNIQETMGVRERAWAHVPGTPLDPASEETSLDLATRAAREAIDDASVPASDVRVVLASTSTPPRMSSTISAPLASSLALRAACMDMRTGCSGGLFALATAALHVSAGCEAALVVGAETFSKVIPPVSKVAVVSLGDGAGALVLRRDPSGSGALLSAAMETDGALGGLITTDGALPPTAEEMTRGGYLLSGAPEELSQIVPGKYEAAIRAALDRAGVAASDVDLYVPHQTSAPLVAKVAAAFGIPSDKAFVNVHRHANVGAAGWLVALAEARAEGRVGPGATVLLAAVGGGMSWAAAVVRW